ncbi:unnamed protein product, partial [Hapterophycus canaliculatus]
HKAWRARERSSGGAVRSPLSEAHSSNSDEPDQRARRSNSKGLRPHETPPYSNTSEGAVAASTSGKVSAGAADKIITLRCMYTNQKTKKRKTWSDGAVKCCPKSQRVSLYRWSEALGVTDKLLGEIYLTVPQYEAFVTEAEPELEMEVYIASLDGVIQPDRELSGAAAAARGASAAMDSAAGGGSAGTTALAGMKRKAFKAFKPPSRREPPVSAAPSDAAWGVPPGRLDQLRNGDRSGSQSGDPSRDARGTLDARASYTGFGHVESLWDDDDGEEERHPEQPYRREGFSGVESAAADGDGDGWGAATPGWRGAQGSGGREEGMFQGERWQVTEHRQRGGHPSSPPPPAAAATGGNANDFALRGTDDPFDQRGAVGGAEGTQAYGYGGDDGGCAHGGSGDIVKGGSSEVAAVSQHGENDRAQEDDHDLALDGSGGGVGAIKALQIRSTQDILSLFGGFGDGDADDAREPLQRETAVAPAISSHGSNQAGDTSTLGPAELAPTRAADMRRAQKKSRAAAAAAGKGPQAGVAAGTVSGHASAASAASTSVRGAGWACEVCGVRGTASSTSCRVCGAKRQVSRGDDDVVVGYGNVDGVGDDAGVSAGAERPRGWGADEPDGCGGGGWEGHGWECAAENAVVEHADQAHHDGAPGARGFGNDWVAGQDHTSRGSNASPSRPLSSGAGSDRGVAPRASSSHRMTGARMEMDVGSSSDSDDG